MQGCADPAAQALGHDLWAQLAHVSGRYEQAIAHGMKVVACPEGARRPQEWSATMTRLGSSNDRLGRYEEALRWHYRGLPFAAGSGDPVAYASALGSVGGLQLSLLNVEEAAALCGQAWDLVRPCGPGSTWGVCAINWAMVLMLQKRYPQAMPLADAILAADEALGSYNRHKRRLLLGELMAHAGQVVRAQQLLDEGLALSPNGPESPLDWARGQATLDNAAGRPAQALALCQSALARPHLSGQTPIDADYDLMSFNTQAACAQ